MQTKQNKLKELQEVYPHFIDVWEVKEITNEHKESDTQESYKMSIWANIIPQTNKLQVGQANTILSKATHKIKVRYEAGKSIENNMFIMFNGQRFDIEYILNPYFANQRLEIFVEDKGSV